MIVIIIKKILLLFVISTSLCLAQNFFPLKVGNAYQVKSYYSWHAPGGSGSGTDYFNLIVNVDSLVYGESFYGFSSNYYYSAFDDEFLFRYDSLNQKLLIKLPQDTIPKLAVDFLAPIDSHYISFIRGEPLEFVSQGNYLKLILGDTVLVYSMLHPRSLSGYENEYYYEFADNLGFLKHTYIQMTSSTSSLIDQDLLAAIIDSVVYNPLILTVDSLYPADDRPIDTFPFLLTIPYTASYSSLVDSFYLDVEHVRYDTLVQTKKYTLPKSNPSHVSLYLAGLQVGDQLKLRATITDSSIFHNIDHYPDTGWVVMNILPPILSVENGNQLIDFELAQNYPNPFNPLTRIRYQIPETAFVTIKVYDVLGNEVETLVNEENIAGNYEVIFDGSALTSGIYYYRITAGYFSKTNKMILIK